MADVSHLTDGQRLELIARIAASSDLDENLGDTTERAQTILFVASRGEQGRDWGLTYMVEDMEGGDERH